MTKLKLLMIFFCFLASTGYSQEKTDTAAIRAQLKLILDRDQKTRVRGDSLLFAQWIDSTNLVQIESLIARYGWPGKSFVGATGNIAVFLVIQHSDLAIQEKYLPLLKASVADSQSMPCDLALLKDRILMRQGKKQLYGSQIARDSSNGGWKFYPIEDEKNVNARRKLMGLEPIEQYALRFGIEYKAPVD